MSTCVFALVDSIFGATWLIKEMSITFFFLQVVVSHLMCVIRTKLLSSVRAANVHNHGDFSPALRQIILHHPT